MANRNKRLLASLAALAMVLLVGAATAQATTFPGENGRLALSVEVRPFPEASPVFTIQTANSDGTDFVRLTDPISPSGLAEHSHSARWSADGKRLAFSTFSPGGASRLEVMDADGSDRAVVLEDSGSGDWFPDGTRIFLGSRVVDVDSGTTTPVGTFDHLPDGLNLGSWDLSPDGTKVAFDGWYQFEQCDYFEDPPDCWLVDDSSHIYVVNIDGSGLTQLPAVSWNRTGAAWSPDGRKLAYVLGGDIRAIDADGENDVGLGVRGHRPLWSPDGQQLLYELPGLIGGNDGPDPDQYVIGADGSNPTKIIEGDPFEAYSVSSWQPIVNQAPDCKGVSAGPATLLPANRKLRLVRLLGGTDPDGDPVNVEITGVTQDEPTGSGHDAEPAADRSRVRLRAERDVRGEGRVYRIAFEVNDGRGGSCTGEETVSVPRHRNVAAVDSGPPGYDSFGG